MWGTTQRPPWSDELIDKRIVRVSCHTKNLSLSLIALLETNQPTVWTPMSWSDSPVDERQWRKKKKKKLFGRNASVADLFLSMWSDRVPVRTSSYLKGMRWRDLRGEKVTQVTSEAKCLDCVRAPLATRRSSTLPCLSSSQLGWMRPAGTAPLSDNCDSSLCPCNPPPPRLPPCPSGSPGLINHTYNTAPRCRQGALGSFRDLRSKCALQRTPG